MARTSTIGSEAGVSRGGRIGITLGDPAGVGPEIVARALATDGAEGCTVFGDPVVLAEVCRRAGLPLPPRIVPVTELEGVAPGRPDARVGAAQVAYLEAAVAAALAGELDALVTAPIHKAACKAAGFSFPGHTEFLADCFAVPEVAMMLAGPHLRVVPATIDMALRDVPGALSRTLASAIALTLAGLHDDFGIDRPRVAVAALNPHAGESGHFGDEERRVIEPAMEEAVARIHARFEYVLTGPAVPDAVYRAACKPPFGDGRFDAVVGAYHDQALIPVKLVDFEEAVNVTLGLPIPRTSPDHGVAYDVAGTSAVRDTSFRAALRLGRELAARRGAARRAG